ncbi:hypothetical protein [Spongiivirga citrea]|uniref:Uncharacterized protein n=1 Tax=Spongiivirga citrea TaxID=1481457 RepID=A0A6M0CJI1_9FLAO|nr:hypothetical protein [Spongiivirga citrea]NER18095.1 hypothetical protein [Spongiivirga citrea]
MKEITATQRGIFAVGIPIALQLSLVILVRSAWFTNLSNDLALAISIDFLITMPFIYWLLVRKTKIPTTTVIPFFIASTILASFLIPLEHQSFINTVKTWAIPVLEIGVLSYVGSRIYLTRKNYKKNILDQPDIANAIQDSCEEILPKSIASFLANEISVFYYAFFKWKKHTPVKNEFTYHKKSGSITVFAALLFVVAIETVALHLILNKWSPLAAWIATGVSIYSAIFLIGIIKSIPRRLIKVKEKELFIPYGIFGFTRIEYKNIKSINTGKISVLNNEKLIGVSPFLENESPNVSIETDRPITVNGLYGMKKKTTKVVFTVDELSWFNALLRKKNSLEESTESR